MSKIRKENLLITTNLVYLISPLAEWKHGEPGEVSVDGRPHGEVGDERVEEDVLAVEQLVHLGADLARLDVGVVLQNIILYR